MRITKRLCDARGSAVVEFIVIAVGIMVPVGYLIVAVASVLGAQAAAQHAVREAGRVFVRDLTLVAGESTELGRRWISRSLTEVS
jgi:Flp pilus assembly protein TadG